jgi:hypothetical protein
MSTALEDARLGIEDGVLATGLTIPFVEGQDPKRPSRPHGAH